MEWWLPAQEKSMGSSTQTPQLLCSFKSELHLPTCVHYAEHRMKFIPSIDKIDKYGRVTEQRIAKNAPIDGFGKEYTCRDGGSERRVTVYARSDPITRD